MTRAKHADAIEDPHMRRRIIGFTLAALMAALGTFSLVAYVRSAEDRALEGQELADVYVVAAPIAAGTPAEGLAGSLRLEPVPVKLRAETAVADLSGVAGLVTGVDLVPGEQLTLARMVPPGNQPVRSDGVLVPPGMVEVTIELAPTQAVGGMVGAGDTVGVIVTFDSDEPTGEAPIITPEGQVQVVSGPSTVAGTTHLFLHKVLITAKQVTGVVGDDGTAPSGSFLVTLAVSPADAERVVYGAEFGRLWLVAQGPDVPETGTRIQNRATVHQPTADRRPQ
jgi:pilus assembly protein CpaB